MQFDSRPIGVFDSGVGGLTVLQHLIKLMPNEHFIYLGDTARVPYGNKSAETVQLYSLQCAAFLADHNVKLIVVACNTASALAIDVLRTGSDIPVIGMIEPAASKAVSETKTGIIGVIGTRATVLSEVYEHAISQEAARLSSKPPQVISIACPLLVPLVEEGWLDTPSTRLIAEEYLNPFLTLDIDTLVLGCTHYPLLTPVISSILPNVRLIDCGASAAEIAISVVQPASDTTPQTLPNEFFVTDNTPAFSTLANSFLGLNITDPTRVSVDSYPRIVPI